MMGLAQLANTARSGVPWSVISSCKMTLIPCRTGTLATSLDYVRYNNKVELTTLCLRFVRTSDQKAYNGTFDNEYLKGARPMGNDPKIIETWLGTCESALALSQECVVTFRRFSESVTFILHGEIDSVAEQIAQLKREHAAELDALHEKYKWAHIPSQDDERFENDDVPCAKKSRVVKSPSAQYV